MEATVTQINQVDYISANTSTTINPSVRDLFYKLTFDASAAVEIVTLLIGAEIHHSLGKWYHGISTGAKVTGTSAQKFIVAKTVVSIMQEANGKLIKVLYPDDSVTTIIVDDINAGLKRHRLLSELDGEMDNNVLSDYDDMTLGDLDDVILEE